MSYANVKGRFNGTARVVPVTSRPTPDELTAEEKERIAGNREFVKQHMPELIDLIKALHAEGLIDGWRAVRGCRKTEGGL